MGRDGCVVSSFGSIRAFSPFDRWAWELDVMRNMVLGRRKDLEGGPAYYKFRISSFDRYCVSYS